jgi:hypothetical protein
MVTFSSRRPNQESGRAAVLDAGRPETSPRCHPRNTENIVKRKVAAQSGPNGNIAKRFNQILNKVKSKMKIQYILGMPFVASYDNDLDALVPELWAQESLAILNPLGL